MENLLFSMASEMYILVYPSGRSFGNIYRMHINFYPELLLLGVYLVDVFMQQKSILGDDRQTVDGMEDFHYT